MQLIPGPVFYNRNRVARPRKMKKMLSVVKVSLANSNIRLPWEAETIRGSAFSIGSL